MAISVSKQTPFRPHDYIYDPLFVVSGPKDHYKAAMIAKLTTAKFQVCPIFPNMFSDLPNHPRKQLILRTSTTEQAIRQNRRQNNYNLSVHKPVDIIGMDRHKYFYQPMPPPPPPLLLMEIPPSSSPQQSEGSAVKKSSSNKKIQTMYRESSAQTVPWQPSHAVMDNSDPEILKLDFLKWGAGLPAGVHEVKLIERARMKRAWEEKLRLEGAGNLEKRRDIIEAMERDEWLFREQEIQDIQDLRLELLEEMLSELHEKSKRRSEEKVRSIADTVLAIKDEKVAKMKKKYDREMRKLIQKETKKTSSGGGVQNIIDNYKNRRSEIYAPLVRDGDQAKHWHQIIDESMKKYRAQFIGVEHLTTLPRGLHEATKMKDCCCLKLPGTRLCMRETKWTTPVLKQLHEDLKNLNKPPTRLPCTLRTMRVFPPSRPTTPEVEGCSDETEDKFQATVYLQSIFKGRSTQMLIYEGRDRCRQLIQELKYSTSLLKDQNKKIYKEKLKVKRQQQTHILQMNQKLKLQEDLNKLQGNIVGSLLDFLNKLLQRLEEERKIHAMCLLFDRERHQREAAEAGRRQQEITRRHEHDEMFKQMTRVHQDTVDLYLEDIVKESIEFTSEEHARLFIDDLASKIDAEAYHQTDHDGSLVVAMNEEEEIIAEIVHHFLLPEVDKELVRKRLKMQQRDHLKCAHDAIYSEIEDLRRPSNFYQNSSFVLENSSNIRLADNFEMAGEKKRFMTTVSSDMVQTLKDWTISAERCSEFNEHFVSFDDDEVSDRNSQESHVSVNRRVNTRLFGSLDVRDDGTREELALSDHFTATTVTDQATVNVDFLDEEQSGGMEHEEEEEEEQLLGELVKEYDKYEHFLEEEHEEEFPE